MQPPQSPMRRAVRPLLIAAGLGLFFFAAQVLRTRLGIEWSTDSIQQAVAQLGILAPLGFAVLVMFRQFMALPSVLVLTSAGLLFGAPAGMLLGGLGITLNGLALFYSARLMGGDWARTRLHATFPEFEQRANSAGPLALALMTGHPMGVLTPFHLAAGLTRMSVWLFAAVVFPAALFRAGCYAFLGANLLEPGSPRFWVASAVLVAVALLPLAHPGLRARLLSRPDPAEDTQADTSHSD
jgi:uncharacterized membrane protein YdjX (TVP38/TMEM64 family)